MFFSCSTKLLRHEGTHLNRRFPGHKHIRANITNVEMPEETSLFAELETLTEHVHERDDRDLWRAAGWRRADQWKNVEAVQEEHRNLIKRRAKKAAKNWRRRSKWRRGWGGRVGPGNPGVAEPKVESRVRDLEVATF